VLHGGSRSEDLKGRDHLEDLDVDGRVIVESILKCEGVVEWILVA
jgi:hypothetical protein